MTIEAEHDPQVTTTTETNRFLDNLQKDSTEILGLKKELGLRVKDILAARVKEFADLGYLEGIPSTDFLWSDDPLDEYDETPGQLGLVVHRDEDSENGYTESGVIMTPDGVLWESSANDGLGGDRFSFDFEDATEVPLEDYPKYFDEAVQAMKYITDEKTGVHAAEYRKQRAEELAAHIQKIKDDNQRHGVEGAEFTGDPKTIEKANEFMQRIADMRKMVVQGNRGITAVQLENLLGHIFAAQEYSESEERGIDINTYGARELVLMVGILISSRDRSLGEFLHGFIADMWTNAPSQSVYLVRRVNQVPYRDNPDSEKIYDAMAQHCLSRLHEEKQLMSVPQFKQPPAEVATESHGTVSVEEITDWLLNEPVSEPRKSL